MTKRSIAIASAALVVLSVATVAGAQPNHHAHTAHTAKGSAGPRTYVDTDGNGVWTTVDKKFPAEVAPGVLYAKLTDMPGRPGAVIGSSLPGTAIVIAASGIRVNSSIGGNMLNLVSTNGDIWIAPGVHVNESKYGIILDASNGTIHIGDGATINASGGGPVSIRAKAVEIGNNVEIANRDANSGSSISATGGLLTVGTGFKLTAPVLGDYVNSSVSLATCGNISLDRATLQAENISVRSNVSCSEGGSIAITNSTLKLNTDSTALLDLSGGPVNLAGTTITPNDVPRL